MIMTGHICLCECRQARGMKRESIVGVGFPRP